MRSYLTNAHPITLNDFLRSIIDRESDGEQHQADHEERTIMNAPAHHFPHFLNNDPGHDVHRLKESSKSLAKIRNRNPVSSAEQNHHHLSNHPTESQQDGGNNSRERRRHQDAQDGLEAV